MGNKETNQKPVTPYTWINFWRSIINDPNCKVISKHWVTLRKCQYSFKHWQPHFPEGGKCIFIIQVVFQSSGMGNKCFDLRRSTVLPCVITFLQLYNLLLIFHSLISSAIRTDWQMNSWQKGVATELQLSYPAGENFPEWAHTEMYLLKSWFWSCTEMAFKSLLIFHLSFCVKISQPACSSMKNYLTCSLKLCCLTSYKFSFLLYFLEKLKTQYFKAGLVPETLLTAKIPSAGSKMLISQTLTPHTSVIKAPQLCKLS